MMKFNKILLLTTSILFIGCGEETIYKNPTPTSNPTPMPTPSPSPTPTPTSSPSPIPTPTSSPSPTPMPTPSPIPTPETVSYEEKFINDTNCNQIIDNEFIVMCYDYHKKAVKAVSYTLMGDLINEVNIKDRPSFYVEKQLKKEDRVTTKDYTNSGYDRGHMAPDASFDWSEESLYAVYTLANIIPQAPKVNRYSWAKLEAYVRDKAEELGELTVINVVKYADTFSLMGESQMTISQGYYKILFNEAAEYEACFYYSNERGLSTDSTPVLNHKVACSSVTN